MQPDSSTNTGPAIVRRGQGWEMHLGDCIGVVDAAGDHVLTHPETGELAKVVTIEFRADFTAGFTLALKSDALGRRRDAAAASADVQASGESFARTFLSKLSPGALAYFGAKS